MMHKVRLVILLCDTPIPTVLEKRGTYKEIFADLLTASLPDSSVEWELEAFDVVNEERYPDLTDGGYDGVLLTGSAASAYDDKPWIDRLVTFLKQTVKDHPKVKIVGICFGHQVLARALGGTCVPNGGKWEVGVHHVDLTQEGKTVFRTNDGFINIQQMHRDHVPSIPPDAILLGSTPICPVQGYVVPYDASLPLTPSNIHAFAVQGHPEFNADIVNAVITVRAEKQVMSAETVQDGRDRAGRNHDGNGLIGRAIWSVLGVEVPVADQ